MKLEQNVKDLKKQIEEKNEHILKTGRDWERKEERYKTEIYNVKSELKKINDTYEDQFESFDICK